jgi:hypothetical protein
MKSFGCNCDDPLLASALWIQAWDSLEEINKIKETFAYHYLMNPFADASISVCLSFDAFVWTFLAALQPRSFQ